MTTIDIKNRIDRLNKRLDTALVRKDGDGPTVSDVHVPTADGTEPRRKKVNAA